MQDAAALSSESLAAEICADGASPDLLRLFRANGAAAPRLLWSPAEADLENRLLRQFFARCRLAAEREALCVTDLGPDSFAGLEDWLLRLSIEYARDTGASGPAGATRFRYGAYGRVLQTHRGRDMTGALVGAHGGHIGLFFDAVYRAVMRRGEWLFSVHEPPKTIFAQAWHRLIVPVFDTRGGSVVEIVALVVPENEYQAGLEIIPDPVLIADADLIVRFANRAAREVFGQTVYHTAREMTLADFAGIDLGRPPPPEEMMRHGAVRDEIALVIRDRLVTRFSMTLSAVSQGGRAFYVVMLRPDLRDGTRTARPEPPRSGTG
jgi:PAS domain-containing protein